MDQSIHCLDMYFPLRWLWCLGGWIKFHWWLVNFFCYTKTGKCSRAGFQLHFSPEDLWYHDCVRDVTEYLRKSHGHSTRALTQESAFIGKLGVSALSNEFWRCYFLLHPRSKSRGHILSLLHSNLRWTTLVPIIKVHGLVMVCWQGAVESHEIIVGMISRIPLITCIIVGWEKSKRPKNGKGVETAGKSDARGNWSWMSQTGSEGKELGNARWIHMKNETHSNGQNCMRSEWFRFLIWILFNQGFYVDETFIRFWS